MKQKDTMSSLRRAEVELIEAARKKGGSEAEYETYRALQTGGIWMPNSTWRGSSLKLRGRCRE